MYPTLSQIEGLFEDINFSTKVTRDTLEEICADLFRQVKNPVQDVLRSTEITMVRPHLLYMSTIGTSGSATHTHVLQRTHLGVWWHLQTSDTHFGGRGGCNISQ